MTRLRPPGLSLARLPRPRGARVVPPRVALPGAVLLALGLVFLAAWGTRSMPGPVAGQSGQQVAVTTVTRSCPPSSPGAGSARVSVVAVPARGSATKASAAGTARFSAVSAKAARSVTVSTPATAAMVNAPGGGASTVTATGQMAQGFEAEQSDASGTGLVNCSHPSSDMWFVGTGQAAGASAIWLYLTNTGNVTASADVTIITDTGLQNGLSNAITIAPDRVVSVNVTPYVHGSQAVALHVQAATGQVAASAWEGGASGGAWLPRASAPSTSLVIPGLTVANDTDRLFVVVPGSSDAHLKVVAYTPAGSGDQFPGTPVDASAGAVTPLPLTSLGASAAGLKLTSSQPVVAGVLVPGAGIGSFTTAEPPITEQGVVAGNPSTRGETVGLVLTAPSAAARASISVIGADGSVTTPAGDGSVTVASGHTISVAVTRPSTGGRRPFSIVITPLAGSGPLYAARVVTSGNGGLSAKLIALLPVPSAKTSIALPPARNSYTAVLPLFDVAVVAGVHHVGV